jgi:beta-galactosidase
VGETKLLAVAGEYRDESVIRKVEVFNEVYRLREKGAILNWFDITEVEGHLSINDKMSDIMATLQGKILLGTLLMKFMPKKGDKMMGGFEMNDDMMQMMGGFTFLRLAGMIGTMGINLTKEQLLDINAKLNKIKKPKNAK